MWKNKKTYIIVKILLFSWIGYTLVINYNENVLISSLIIFVLLCVEIKLSLSFIKKSFHEKNDIKNYLEIENMKEKLEIKNKEYDAITDLLKIVTSTFDINNIIKYIYDVFKKFSKCDRYLICFFENNMKILKCKYEYGDITLNDEGNEITIDNSIKECISTGKSIIKSNIFLDERFQNGDRILINLNISKELQGVICVESINIGSFQNLDLKFFESISKYTTIALSNVEMYNNIYLKKQENEILYKKTYIANKELNSFLSELANAKEELKIKNTKLTKFYDDIQKGYLQTVMALANSIEAKDYYTRGHCQRVMEISCEIAKRMDFSDTEIEDLRYASVLHDIGKIGIPASIINKKGKLNKDEYDEIKSHPIIAYNILREVEFLENGLEGILQHHEWYNGCGYPNGLRGKEISKFGRILCIADAFDAMTSNRPYQKNFTMNEALKEIEKYKGIQFDPEVADIFLELSKHIFTENEKNNRIKI